MDPQVSLLYVSTVCPTIRLFLAPYASHFRALGWRVDAAASGATRDPVLREAFDHVYEVPLPRSILDLKGLMRGERAISTILSSRPQIVHTHTPIASFITRLATRRLPQARRPAVAYTAHGFHFYRGGHVAANALFLAAERMAGRWTDRLVVINDEDYEAARAHRIVRSTRLVRMPGIGVDTDFYSRTRLGPGDAAETSAALGLDARMAMFVVAGELNKNKRPGDVIEALALMRHKNVALVFGGEGSERRRLESLVRARGLCGRVRFAGFVQDIRPLVGSAIALVSASHREGLSRSIMEAHALEVPVVASTARGNLELVHPDSGLIFATGDVNQLAAHMDWLLDHPVERLEMGRCGRRRMVERYDLRNVIRLHEQMYGDMLAARRAMP